MGTRRGTTGAVWVLAVACHLPGVANAQALPSDARVDAGSDDVLVLHDGTTLRGRIAVATPGATVRIVLADDSVRTVAWNDIFLARGPTLTLPEPGPGAGTANATGESIPPELLSRAPGRIPLRVESPARPLYIVEPVPGLAITVRGRNEPVWRQVCAAPCTLHVLPGSITLHGSQHPDGSHEEIWHGVVAPPGLRVQVWSAEDLAAATDVPEPEVRARADVVRDVLVAQQAWDRTHQRTAAAGRSASLGGLAMLAAGGSSVYASVLMYAINASNERCQRGLFGADCGVSSATLLVGTVGLTTMLGGLVLTILAARHHEPPRPELQGSPSVELPYSPE